MWKKLSKVRLHHFFSSSNFGLEQGKKGNWNYVLLQKNTETCPSLSCLWCHSTTLQWHLPSLSPLHQNTPHLILSFNTFNKSLICVVASSFFTKLSCWCCWCWFLCYRSLFFILIWRFNFLSLFSSFAISVFSLFLLLCYFNWLVPKVWIEALSSMFTFQNATKCA